MLKAETSSFDLGVAARKEVEDPQSPTFERAVDQICHLNFAALSHEDVIALAHAYYYFSIQFRENLEIARELYPDDHQLELLALGECDTDNLSPFPGVAAAGEKMNHDEYMRRTLALAPLPDTRRRKLQKLGEAYLKVARGMDRQARALSIASYEDGGLQSVFHAFLQARHWEGPLHAAFHHFLTLHIKFDSDPHEGHGALCRHLTPNDSITPLWTSFLDMLVKGAPALAQRG